MTASGAQPRPARRSHRRGQAAILVLLGAAGTAGSAFLPWWRRGYHDPLTGALSVTVDGGDIAVALVPLALVAVAGLAAAMISRGALRRILGTVVALAAAGSTTAALLAAGHTPDAEFAARLVRPATPQSAPEIVWASVILAVAAALVGVAGGVMVALSGDRGNGRGRSAGLAYRPPAAQRDAARNHAAVQGRSASRDEAVPDAAARPPTAGADAAPRPARSSQAAPDQADPEGWWRALDAGVDPTDDSGPA